MVILYSRRVKKKVLHKYEDFISSSHEQATQGCPFQVLGLLHFLGLIGWLLHDKTLMFLRAPTI